MKGAFLLSENSKLFEGVREILDRAGAHSSSDRVVQLDDGQDHLLTVFGEMDPAYDWEWREGDIEMFDGSEPPQLANMTACAVECRWENLFANTMAAIGAGLSTQAWVLDGDGVLWPASGVDPASVRL